MAHYGKFCGVENYMALIGKKEPELDEKCGYYGERLVLKAQQLGLNTCWVASTYSKIKSAFDIEKGEILRVVISLGYGKTQGIPHKSKTLWVASTYSKIKSAFDIEKGEILRVVISLGYGKTQGIPHKSKTLSEVASVKGEMPDWFQRGVEAALLAPTAMNQQKFRLQLDGNVITAKAGVGFYTKIDLGIIKYHFEIGAGGESFSWK